MGRIISYALNADMPHFTSFFKTGEKHSFSSQHLQNKVKDENIFIITICGGFPMASHFM